MIDTNDFRYFEEVISQEHEQKILSFAEGLSFQPYVMRGQASKRGIARFGYDYGPVGGTHHVVQPIPEELIRLRAICAERAGLDPNSFVASLVTRYTPGATIGWHSDLPQFGPVVFGVSLLNTCLLKLRPMTDPRKVLNIQLEPRSLYVMQGNIRREW